MVNGLALILTALTGANLPAVPELPENKSRPVVRLQETGTLSPSSHMPDWLYEFDLQADIWAPTQVEALALLADVSAVLRTHPTNAHGAVTRFQEVGRDYQPDPDWPVNPGRPGPRYIALLRIHAHPAA